MMVNLGAAVNFIHDDCDDRAPMPERAHPVCDVCWLTHPEGACDR